MAIALDAASNSGVKVNQSSTSGYNHTGGSVTNGCAVILISYQDSTPGTISSVTYGGNTCTLVGTVHTHHTSNGIAIYRLLAFPSGSQAVVVNFSEAMNSHIITTITYSGVHQTTPFGTTSAVDDFDTVNPARSEVTISSATGELVLAISQFTSATASATTGNTSRGSALDSGNHHHGACEEAGVASTVMAWDLAETRNNAILGVALKPAASGEAHLLSGLFGKLFEGKL